MGGMLQCLLALAMMETVLLKVANFAVERVFSHSTTMSSPWAWARRDLKRQVDSLGAG